jgi:hypothetical protein
MPDVRRVWLSGADGVRCGVPVVAAWTRQALDGMQFNRLNCIHGACRFDPVFRCAAPPPRCSFPNSFRDERKMDTQYQNETRTDQREWSADRFNRLNQKMRAGHGPPELNWADLPLWRLTVGELLRAAPRCDRWVVTG